MWSRRYRNELSFFDNNTHNISPNTPTLAIIGAGPSGIITACTIAHFIQHACTILLFSGRPFDQVPPDTSTTDLLNTEQDHLSLLNDKPTDFEQWLDAYVQSTNTAKPEALSYPVYDRYLKTRLHTAVSTPQTPATLTPLEDKIIALTQKNNGWQLPAQSGTLYEAHHVILALGNPLEASPHQTLSQVNDPLLQNILAQGFATLNQAKTGLNVFDDLTVEGGSTVDRRLYAVGPLAQQAHQAALTVADIRKMAETIALGKQKG